MPPTTHFAESVPFTKETWTARRWSRVRLVATPLAATVLLALCAHTSFPLPHTPIPVTMQTFGVLLIGLLFGPMTALSTMLLYLAEGAVGLPVFSPNGVGGTMQLFGPSAGYLLSYPLAALLTAHLFSAFRHYVSTLVASLAACLVAEALILVCGSAWLMDSLHVSASYALRLGMLPFLLGETLKLMLLAFVVTAFQRETH